MNKNHQIFEYAKNYNLNKHPNLRLINDKLCLKNNILEENYNSNIIEILPSKKIIASWGAITNLNSTVEIKIKAFINNNWSDYISYGKWGLGRKNQSHNQENTLIKLDQDEIIILNNATATAIQYQIILSRKRLECETPKFSFITFGLEISNYSFNINLDILPKEIFHNVPKLCQLIVPDIGNSICSPTTITMMLKYYGFDFSKNDIFEHHYIANLAKDYGNNIFGNWVYNTVLASSFGLTAFVAKMYSINELMYHLTKGPVGISVKGRMISDQKDYTTKGHLLLVTGYKYINNHLYFICNDPNVENVQCEYSLEIIETTWRYIAYVISK